MLVIGAGSIGARHISNLFTLGYRHIAVAEPDQSRKKVLNKNIIWYSHVDTAFRWESPEVVFICTPTNQHIILAQQALTHNAHVFIEKPLSHNLAGVASLLKKIKSKRKIVMVACNYRFHKGFQALEKVLGSKKFGKPLFSRITGGFSLLKARPKYKKIYTAYRQRGGGVLLDSASHVFSYLMPLLGDIRKGAYLENSIHPLGLQSEEIAHIVVEHHTKITSTISLDYVSTHPLHRVEIITQYGCLTLDISGNTLMFDNGKRRSILYKGTDDPNHMFVKELEHFLSCIDRGEKPLQDAFAAVQVLQSILNLQKIS